MVELTRRVGRVVQGYANSDYPEKDNELVQHSMYVTNQILLKLQDGELTTAEIAEALSLLKRFAQVWSAYRERTSEKYRGNLKNVLGKLESFL